MKELILASSSIRRHSLLKKLGLDYSVKAPRIDETPLDGEQQDRYVMRMAKTKARMVSENASADAFVLAADTIVSFADKIIGKPEGKDDAKKILQMLSGQEHEVITAVCLMQQKTELECLVSSKLKFKTLLEDEIDHYCSIQEPYDKAGAYAIQGEAARFVEYLSGSYSNVVGLPLLEVVKLLKKTDFMMTKTF